MYVSKGGRDGSATGFPTGAGWLPMATVTRA